MGRFERTWPNEAVVIRYPRRALAEAPEYLWESELVQVSGQLLTFVHMGVSRFTPAVYRQLKAHWSSIRPLLPPIVYAQGDTTDDKWAKFIAIFGFEPVLLDCPCTDGSNRHIYAHFLRND